MGNTFKRFLAMVLALTMVLSYVPFNTFATETEDPGTPATDVTYVAQIGENKYQTILAALEAAMAIESSETVKVELLADSREVMPTDFEVLIKSNVELVSATGEAVVAKFYNDGTKYDFVFNSATGFEGKTLTIGKNVTFQLEDRTIWAGYYGNNIDVVVNGTLWAGYQYWNGADTTVNATGTLKSAGEALVMRRGATLKVDGGKIEANYFSLLSGNLVAENGAVVTCGPVWISNTGNYDNEGNVTITVKNSTLNSNSNLKSATEHANGVKINIENSIVAFGNNHGASILDANTTLNVTGEDTSLTMHAVTNNGTINVSGGAKVVTQEVTGDGDVTVDSESSITDKDGDLKLPVAKIGNQGYETLADAIAAANAMESATVTVLNDVVLDAPLVITGDVTLDLNGKTISQEKACTASYEMISNNGKLTITGNGKISFKDTGAGDPNFGWGSYTIRNAGTLIVENGTIEHLGEQNPGNGQPNVHMYCAIFQYSGSTTINGGTISTPTYRSARLWSGDMTVNGGNFVGQLWVQCVNDTSKLTINGGSFAPKGNDGSSVFVSNAGKKAELSVTGGSFTAKIGASEPANLTGDLVKGGTFTEAAATGTDTALLAEGYEFKQNSDGTYGAEFNPAAGKVAQIGTEYFETLTAAIAAAKAGDTITFVADIEENVTVKKALTIDGAGFKYTGMILVEDGNNIEVIIKNVNFAGGDAYAVKTNTIKSITIEDCTVSGYAYGFLYANKSTPTIVVKNVAVNGGSYGLRWVSGTAATFENVTMTGVKYGIWSQNTGSKTITLKGCNINATESAFYVNETGSAINTFILKGVNEISSLPASQYATVKAEAQNDTKIGSLAAIVADAKNGDTVTVIRDFELVWDGETNVDGLPVFVAVDGKAVTIDLNGKKITGTSGTKNNEFYAAFAVDNDGSLTLKDSVGGASVEITGDFTMYSLLMAYEYGANSATKLIVEGGSYYLENAHDSLIFCGQRADDLVYIKGGNFTLGNVGDGENGKPWIFNVVGSGDGCANITGGTFNADINHQHWSSEAVVDETCYVVANNDGTWTVKDGAVAYVNTGMTTGPYYAPKNIGYATLQEAIAAAVQYNDPEVTLLADVELAETIKISENITLDLNGKTITGTDNETKSFALIEVQPEKELIINDSVGGGVITLTAKNNRGWNAYSSVISNQRGKLTVNGGTIKHLGGTDMAYAIDSLTNTGAQVVETIINGGTIKSPYRAIRQFANSTSAKNILTVNGGTIEGTNKSIWLQQANANANPAALTVAAGATLKGDVYLTAAAGATEFPVELSIAAGALDGESTVLTSNVPAGYVVDESNGKWGVMTGKVAKVNDEYYATLTEAIAAAKAGDTVYIFEGTYAVPSMKAGITIEGVGNVLLEGTLTGTLENLTLKNLHIKGGNAQRWAYAKGDLVFENVIFEATSVYALHFDGITAGSNLLYKDCTIIGWAAMGGSPASCVFDSCTIKDNGTYGVIRTFFDAEIKNCTFDVDGANPNDAYQDGIHAVEGAKVTVNDCTNLNGDMKDLVNIHAESVVVLDGVEIRNVAKVTSGEKVTYYETFEAAYNAANAGDTITLLADMSLSDILVIDKAIALDGNGHKLTSTAGRAINVSGANGVTIKDLTINCSGERAINIIQNATNVTIEKVTATAANYTVNVAASAPNAVVTINNSTLNGLCTVNVSAAGAQIAIDNSTINCNDNNTTAGESYAALSLNKEAINGKITATNSTINVAAGSDSVKAKNGAEGGEITIDGKTDEVGSVVAIITYDGSDYYHAFFTLASAVEFAKAGDTITLIRDVTASEVILINKSLTINGNGHEVTSNATRVFRVTTADVDVTLNDVNMVSNAVRIGSNDIRGISVDDVTGVELTLNNCSVDFTDASANDWTYAVNVVGGSNHTITINGGTYEGANVVNVRGANNTVTVKDAILNCLYPNNDTYFGACIWVQQNQNSSVEATGNTFNGDNALAFNLGTGTALTESNNTDNTKLVVAKVDGSYYYSLAAAFAAAQDGDTIKVLHNIDLAEGITNTKKITLDLNGKTITGTDNITGSFGLITNKGELTITGNGKMTLVATSNRGWNAYSSVISNTVGGKLTIENGTIEHLGGTDMAYAIDNLTNGKGTYAETVINGGTIKSTYRAVRQFLNGVEAQNILTVNGGTIEGANKSIWMQDPSKNANSGTLTVGENAVLKGDVYLFVTAGSTEWPVEVSIDGKALADGSKVVTGNVPATYVVENVDGTWGVVRGLKGSGTQADPYQISTLSELILFRDSVNAGETKYNAPGVYVALFADIDMKDVDWSVNIGDDCNATFDGIFDGQNHTISNLTSTETAQKADGYVCTGLFGAIYGKAVVKNLTIDNANINTGDFTGNNAGIVVGFAYSCTGSIENVKVTNSTLNASKVTGTGAIVGYDYYGTLTIKDCSVENTDVTGMSYVGGIIGYGSNNCTVTGSSFVDGDVTANGGAAGGIAGIFLDNAKAENCTVKNANIVAKHENWQNSAAVVVGTITSKATVTGTTVENVNVTDLVGSVSAEKPTAPVAKVAAKIGDVYYTTFAAAYAAAKEGETITLLTPVVVEAGKELTLNKGVTITYTSDVMGEAMITNNGTLVVDGDTIAYIYSGDPDSSYGKGNYTVANRGDMTVNSGKITVAAEDFTGKFSHALYAIDNYSGSELTINGGEVSNGNNIAIRTFGAADVNVNGGKIEGVRAIWIQLPGSNAAEAPAVKLNVNGGELNSNDATYNLAVYVTTNGQSAKNVKIDIAGGIFNGDVALNTAATGTMVTDSVKVSGGIFNGEYGVFTYADADEKNIIGITGGTFATLYSEQYALDNGYGFKADSGVYMVAPVAEAGYVAVHEGVYYKKLNDAVKAAAAGDVIDLIADAGEDNYALVGKNLTINKNGHTAVAIAALYGYTVLDNDNAYVVVKTSEIVNNAGKALAYIDANLDGYVDEKLMTLQDALDAAQAGQTVRMTADLKVGTIIIPTGVTLDLESHTLTADRVIGLNGSFLTANAMAKNGTGSGILKVEKNNVLLGEACFMKSTTMGVLPVWNKDHYEFSLFAFEVSTTKQGLRVNESTQNINFVFRHMSSDYYMTHVLNDENADHGIKVVLEISWTTDNGVPYQTFVYNSKFFAEVAKGGMNYTFNLDGYEAMFLNVDTMKIVVKVVTETGALLESRPYTMEDNKLN